MQPPLKRITILLAEDHRVVRQAVRKMLEFEPDLEVVGEARDGCQAIALAKKLRPAVMLMDIAMPRLNGLEAARQVLKAVPAIKILMLSAHSDDAYIQMAAESGAAGYLIKQTFARDVCRAIREGQKGKKFFSPFIASRLKVLYPKYARHKRRGRKTAVTLTVRETEILQQIAEGDTNQEIAEKLAISRRTVEKHRSNLMQKLDLHETAGLTRYAISAGLVACQVPLTIV